MKRLFCFLLILVFLPVVSMADIPDISCLSLDDLRELDRQIHFRLIDHQLQDGLLVPAGTYVFGVDIPSGDYRAEVVSTVGGIARLHASIDDLNTLSYIFEWALGDLYGTYSFRLNASDGNVLVLKYNSLKLYPYTGIMDFQ